MAMAHLADARIDCPSLRERIDPRAFRAVQHMVQRRFNAPLTSSVGRLFDAIAALVGLRDRVSFEGQAAMQLEWIATGEKIAESYPFETANPHPHSTDSLELDTRPMIRAIVADLGAATPAAIIARRFHSTLVELILQTCRRLGDLAGITKVVLSGGVFMNALLVSETASHLKSQGFYPFHQHQAPPNDGGLSLGQVAIAARQIGESQCV
jgi:hydrogenase maturation protein HypF